MTILNKKPAKKFRWFWFYKVKKSSKSVIPAKVEKPKKEVAPKAEKPKKTEKSTEEVVEEKPKTTRKKKTEE